MLLNIIAVFSTSWQMFVVVRFLIGLAMGFELTVQYNVMAEFTQSKWRSWVIAVPSWSIEVAIFALLAWAVKNWKYLHVITAALGVIPFISGLL